jgi:glycosyltransferase involved in cell wall biosynthesis
VEIVEVPPPRKRSRDRLSKLRRPRGELAGGAFAGRVADLARWADVIHLEQTETLWSSTGLDVPTLLHVHYLVGLDRPLAPPWTRAGRDRLELSLLERAATRRLRYLVASSPLVAAHLQRKAPHAKVVLAPLTLDPGHYEAAPLDGPPVAGFIGTAMWPPTRAAALRLATEVWPRIHPAAPSATLRIAGRGMDEIDGLRDTTWPGNRIELLGEVPSAASFYRDLSVLVYPLERGSGMKVKVLESMSAGVGVATTERGAEGVAPTPGVIVGRSMDEIALAVIRCLTDPEERKRRGLAARKTFFQHFEPRVATAPLVDLYERMATRPHV